MILRIRRTGRTWPLSTLLCLALLAVPGLPGAISCGGRAPEPAAGADAHGEAHAEADAHDHDAEPAAADPADAEAPELPPGHPPTGPSGEAGSAGGVELPPGHPPIPGSPGAQAVLPPPAGSGTGAAGLTWKTPAGWTETKPSSAMRRAQYAIAGPGGEAECIVYYFGPGQGGDAQANAERWAGQFLGPDGRPATGSLKTSRLEVGGIPVLMVEVAGTMQTGGMGMGPGEPIPDSMLLGAIAEGPDANWFFKLTGPEATVRAQKAAFEGLVRSLRRGA